MQRKNIKILVQFLAILLVLTVVLALNFLITNLFPKKAKAISIFKPFGGRILLTIPCPCMAPGTKLVVVGPPKPGSFMYMPKVSKKYKSGPIVISNHTVGLAIKAAKIPCLSGAACAPAGRGSLIRMIGTSSP